MPTYAFELISAAQVAAFGPSDNLVILGPSAAFSNVAVTYVGPQVTISYAGRTLQFGAGFTSQVHSIRPSGEPAFVIGSTGDDLLTGRDVMATGTPPALLIGDVIYGGPGADTIDGGQGADTVSGGAGADLFVFTSGQSTGDVVTGFEAIDRLALGIVPAAQRYLELPRSTVSAGQEEIRTGRADLVAVQAGPDVHLYYEYKPASLPGAMAMNLVVLKNATVSQIDLSTFVQAPAERAPPPPAPGYVDAPVDPGTETAPTAPAAPGLLGQPRTVGAVIGNMDDIHFGQLKGAASREQTDADLSLVGSGANLRLHGSGLVYDSNRQLIDGQAHAITYTSTGIVPLSLDLAVNGIGQRVSAFGHWVANDASQEALSAFLQGADSLAGSAGADLIRSYDGGDIVIGRGGRDTIFAGAGDDVIYARQPPGATAVEGSGDTYLRGDEGNDWIAGGLGFDDINGNMGEDTASGGAGRDWVVGGKDSDLLFGDAGDDLVYGNLGNDTCSGGDGADIVRGGQDNDVINGFAGDDYMSGDRGSDTVTGGSGADIFHTFGDAGLDVVTDFIYGAGDRVQLDPGTTYTVAQTGFNVVISMGGGGQMILENVLLSTLGPGWIYGA